MTNGKPQNNLSLQEIVKKRYIENDPTLCFDTIPINKIIVLSLITGGFYAIILFYSWWKKLKIDFGYKVSPFWRGLFSGISVFWLFPVFEKYFKCYNVTSFNAGIYSTLFFACCWASNQLSFRNINGSILIEVISWLFLLGTIVITCNTQTRINMINERYYPQAKNNGWKLSNIIWIIICSIILIFPMISQSNKPNNIQEKNTNSSYEEQYNNERQQSFQHHMIKITKDFTRVLADSNIKCGLSSSELTQCFSKTVDRFGETSVSGNVMTFMNDNWKFIGDGICSKNGNCKIEIISHYDSGIKATILIYADENGYISVE